MEKLLEEIISKAFRSGLGQQCEILYSIPDGRIFIRYEEALKECSGDYSKIKSWYKEEW